MKSGILLLLLTGSFFANAQQSLKDALFSGKLKNQPGTVIRKGDDLASKMDTATRKPATEEAAKATAATSPAIVDSATKTAATTQPAVPAGGPATATTVAATPKSNSAATSTTDAAAPTDIAASETAAKPKDNTAIWKEYMKTLAGTLKTEVLSSKKVKKGVYYVLVSYSIGTDGAVTVTDVFAEPQNEFLQQQIKDRLALEAPRLNPVLNEAGQARKVNKKYNFTLTKD